MDEEETPTGARYPRSQNHKRLLKTSSRSPARRKRNETDPSGRGEGINKRNQKPWFCQYASIYYHILLDTVLNDIEYIVWPRTFGTEVLWHFQDLLQCLPFHDLDAQVLVAQRNVEKDPKRRKPVCNIYQKYLFGPRNASFMHSGSAASRSNWTTVRYWKFVVLCKAKKTKVIEWHGIRMSHCSWIKISASMSV